MRPYITTKIERQILQQPLGDATELDVAMVGGEFTVYVIAVRFGFAMQILITGAASDRRHGHHPEMVGIGAQRMQGLLESDLDLEPITVTGDQLQGTE